MEYYKTFTSITFLFFIQFDKTFADLVVWFYTFFSNQLENQSVVENIDQIDISDSYTVEPCYRDANQSDFIVFSTTNRAKYDNTILPIKIRFSPNVCLPLSLSFLLFYFLPNNNYGLAFYLASLFGGNPTKIKSWRSIFITCPDLISVVFAHCTVLHALCSLWLYPVYPVLNGSSPHRTAKQLFVPIY